ncbi:nickel-dependent hydrogenase large subunit, partial [Salmonella enterica subsp. enterica serovar Kentucky]|nr:nickel-dependent hydrogenase large subunit [Salmonella enterica subsp. enterica serovar Kentucky]
AKNRWRVNPVRFYPIYDRREFSRLQPLEILRTLHSFDPCLACSTHVIDNHGGELVRVQVR